MHRLHESDDLLNCFRLQLIEVLIRIFMHIVKLSSIHADPHIKIEIDFPFIFLFIQMRTKRSAARDA